MDRHPLVQRWLRGLENIPTQGSNDVPNYWSHTPEGLLTTSNIYGNVKLGTGYSVYADSILPGIESAETEVILVTCFWARSATLSALADSLRTLSTKALQRGGQIRVCICFSSLSLFQKLFHTTSLQGQIYLSSQWVSKLGLPSSEELKGLDLEVKSIFIRPFSVLRPKFVIIDRHMVYLPSCNVSWEDWFEGCVTLSGDVVGQFIRFWSNVWARSEDEDAALPDTNRNDYFGSTDGSTKLSTPDGASQSVQSIFLPSPHHVNPSFSLLPWRDCPPPPPTPLNTFLLTAIGHAQKSIYMQTPNLTSPPVLSALLAALKRGVNIEILTSDKLMILEQLVTAGSTTSRCVKTLVKRHRRLISAYKREDSKDFAVLEGQPTVAPGKLKVSFYRPKAASDRVGTAAEPVQSHLKLTIVDGKWTVLGSGNLDRASWFTSQELGVAFHSPEFANDVVGEVRRWMDDRRLEVYDSSAAG